MSAELVMAGPGQPVIHNSDHDLESCFYVLLGIFVLLDEPYKPKSDEELARCFDKYFNTFEPSVLKTITIQADLTWESLILQRISPYFEPAINLLIRLRHAIVSPLYVNRYGKFHRRAPFSHDEFIIAIIDTLSGLNADAWVPRSHPNNDRLANQEAHSRGGFGLERNNDDIVAEPEVEFSDEEAGDSPAKSADESSDRKKSATKPLPPPMLLRFQPCRSSGGPGFASDFTRPREDGDLDWLPPNKRPKLMSSGVRDGVDTSPISKVLAGRQGFSTGFMSRRATRKTKTA